jgi:hypothetical protein
MIAILLLSSLTAHAGELQHVRIPILLDGAQRVITAERATTSFDENLIFVVAPKICDVQVKKCQTEAYVSLDFRTGFVQTEQRVYTMGKLLR